MATTTTKTTTTTTTTTTNLTELEQVKDGSSTGAYHAIASKAKLSTIKESSDRQSLFQYLISSERSSDSFTVRKAKAGLLKALMVSGGDTTTRGFQLALEQLSIWSRLEEFDARIKPGESYNADGSSPPELEGTWITLSKPQFSDCLGMNHQKDYMYTLGRMSFDMFCPTQLQCSIQGNFNRVKVLSHEETKKIKHVPSSLKSELTNPANVVRTYDIITAFTIEAADPDTESTSPNYDVNEPIKAVMTTTGYVLPNPGKQNRISCWFTGGRIEVNAKNDDDLKRWNTVFDSKKMPKRPLGERSKLFVAGLLIGAHAMDKLNAQGQMMYDLKRPIGGHDTAYIEILYMDETIRIVQSNKGVIYVFARVPDHLK